MTLSRVLPSLVPGTASFNTAVASGAVGLQSLGRHFGTGRRRVTHRKPDGGCRGKGSYAKMKKGWWGGGHTLFIA